MGSGSLQLLALSHGWPAAVSRRGSRDSTAYRPRPGTAGWQQQRQQREHDVLAAAGGHIAGARGEGCPAP
ncbi:hypothetical protein OPT61_g8873 [Boeremia exigua]|uniref:Uncharacterized protein n=1 Tax=Boeremia exigua TaxID=749465 RepID=A0ACC2HWP1_9PLEO|nr:hypothetical protein OPT61_g8873 [Boeremia exigua]